MRSDAFSATIKVAAFVFAETMVGITEASTTRSPAMPRSLRSGPTTASASMPMRQVPTAW